MSSEVPRSNEADMFSFHEEQFANEFSRSEILAQACETAINESLAQGHELEPLLATHMADLQNSCDHIGSLCTVTGLGYDSTRTETPYNNISPNNTEMVSCGYVALMSTDNKYHIYHDMYRSNNTVTQSSGVSATEPHCFIPIDGRASVLPVESYEQNLEIYMFRSSEVFAAIDTIVDDVRRHTPREHFLGKALKSIATQNILDESIAGSAKGLSTVAEYINRKIGIDQSSHYRLLYDGIVSIDTGSGEQLYEPLWLTKSNPLRGHPLEVFFQRHAETSPQLCFRFSATINTNENWPLYFTVNQSVELRELGISSPESPHKSESL